jgi:predicted nuclease with TOPRIM domain
MLLALAFAPEGFAGVSRAIQEQYKHDYENKAMFLKIPVYSEKQFVYISGQEIRFDQGSGSPRYKVGDQLRVLQVEFASDEVKFRMGGIAVPGSVEIVYKFDVGLQEGFPNREVFNRALQSTLTEGLKYTEIEDAKRDYIAEQFDRSVGEIAASASLNRDSVLKSIAPRVPAYQEAAREIETLKSKIQDVSGQLSQSQSENRKLETESKALEGEVARLRSANAALEEKIDNSASQVSKLGDELRDIKGTAQGYQKELASIQRSLNLKVAAGHDLSSQIAELGQTMRKLQRDSEIQTQQISSLRTSLAASQATNARLVGDNEELKSSNRKMQSTIETLTSKGDSLAKQYLNLRNEKEKLDDFHQSVAFIGARIAEEGTDGGVYHGKANIYLGNVLLGSLDWSLPVYLNHAQTKSAEADFVAESIDTVRMTPEQRHILRTFGERLKIRLDLTSSCPTMPVTSGAGAPLREIGERERSAWQWTIDNQGAEDCQLLLSARLINRNFSEVPLFQHEHPVIASNAVRQARAYLQPVPLALGAVFGFLLFGIVGIFRRSRKPPRTEPPAYVGQKQL